MVSDGSGKSGGQRSLPLLLLLMLSRAVSRSINSSLTHCRQLSERRRRDRSHTSNRQQSLTPWNWEAALVHLLKGSALFFHKRGNTVISCHCRSCTQGHCVAGAQTRPVLRAKMDAGQVTSASHWNNQPHSSAKYYCIKNYQKKSPVCTIWTDLLFYINKSLSYCL